MEQVCATEETLNVLNFNEKKSALWNKEGQDT